MTELGWDITESVTFMSNVLSSSMWPLLVVNWGSSTSYMTTGFMSENGRLKFLRPRLGIDTVSFLLYSVDQKESKVSSIHVLQSY